MQKRLLAWRSEEVDVTVGKVYEVVGRGFIDDAGDPRSASLGTWGDTDLTPAADRLTLRPGIVVATDSIADQDVYEAVCGALIQAGASAGEFWHGTYPWKDWKYVGWSQANGDIMHWDDLQYYGGQENVTVKKADDILSAPKIQEEPEVEAEMTPNQMLESGHIVDFEDGTSGMYIDKACNGRAMFLLGMKEGEIETLIHYNEQLEHNRKSKNVVAIYAQGGLGCGLGANLEDSDHFGRRVLWKRDETVVVLGHKVSKSKLESFLEENAE